MISSDKFYLELMSNGVMTGVKSEKRACLFKAARALLHIRPMQC